MLVATSACIVNTDDPCSHGRVEIKGGITGCVCAPGMISNADNTGCVPCGANEEAKDGACVCIAGYQASKEGCVPVPPDAGESDAGGGTDS
ncbi:MAG TPA: hypothetical protein VI299_14970, partial [Polyangiales bacterium]